MTEMVKPLRDMIPLRKYKGGAPLQWDPASIEAFEYCQQAISNCQELYFLEDTVTPILQTDASDYGVGGYLFSVTNGKVRVIRFFSKALIRAQLKWFDGLDLARLVTAGNPDARGQDPRLPPGKHNEDSHP
jgi:hypothetical protein